MGACGPRAAGSLVSDGAQDGGHSTRAAGSLVSDGARMVGIALGLWAVL